MRKLVSRLSAVALISAAAGAASATPLKMKYCVTDIGGGLFQYKIELALDNNDGSWVPGHGFSWIIWGDAFLSTSPLSDWVIDPGSLPCGPFPEQWWSSGGHNGPNFGPVIPNTWIPNAIGDKLEWKGTSATNLGAGQMLWTNLIGTGGAGIAEFIVGELQTSCGVTCYPDCNQSGTLTIADFGCFQNAFVANQPYGDCNNSGTWTIADFACFQTAFVNGCP